jgi:hypothetical protein
MSVEFNAENRNARMVLPTRRCCSFCRNPGHNISTCNDTRLIHFRQLCISRESSLGNARFINWLLNYSIENPNIVRAYAVRYCNCPIRTYMHTCINVIAAEMRELNLNDSLRERVQPAEGEEPEQSHPQTEMPQHNDDEMLGRLITGGRLLHAVAQSGSFGRLTLIEIIVSMMFLDMIHRIRDEFTHNRKFNIQTNIVECAHTNECECNICYDNKIKQEFVKLNCGHEFCKDCIKQTFKNVRTENPQCAFCRAEINNMELSSQIIRDEFNDVLLN